MRTHERITMTITKTNNYVSTATGSRAKTNGTKSSTKKTKKFVQMKRCQVYLNGDKLGKEFRMPVDCTDYTRHFERLMNTIPKTSAFWVSVEDEVRVEEHLVLHTGKLEEYRKLLQKTIR